MPNTLKMLAQALATVAASIYYTVPASTTTIVKKIGLCNTSDTQTAHITLHIVPNGGSITNTNMMTNELELLAKETKFINPDDYLAVGWTIRGIADIDNIISVQISGVEMS